MPREYPIESSRRAGCKPDSGTMPIPGSPASASEAVLAAERAAQQHLDEIKEATESDLATRLSLLRANDPKLVMLTLNQLDFATDGVFDALKGNSVLSVLNMWGSNINADNMGAFAGALQGTTSLTNLSVGKVRP